MFSNKDIWSAFIHSLQFYDFMDSFQSFVHSFVPISFKYGNLIKLYSNEDYLLDIGFTTLFRGEQYDGPTSIHPIFRHSVSRVFDVYYYELNIDTSGCNTEMKDGVGGSFFSFIIEKPQIKYTKLFEEYTKRCEFVIAEHRFTPPYLKALRQARIDRARSTMLQAIYTVDSNVSISELHELLDSAIASSIIER